MIEAFSTNRSDDAFDVASLPWRSWRAQDLLDVHGFDLISEFVSVDSVLPCDQLTTRRSA